MGYSAADLKWQCRACGFENNSRDQGKGEEKRESNALLAIPLTEPLFDGPGASSPGYWGAPGRRTSLLKKAPAATKTCPACGKQMRSNGPGMGWQCRACGYERRI
jgi:ribosomal protein L37AE/L43A